MVQLDGGEPLGSGHDGAVVAILGSDELMKMFVPTPNLYPDLVGRERERGVVRCLLKGQLPLNPHTPSWNMVTFEQLKCFKNI